jgi:hypothetical protein
MLAWSPSMKLCSSVEARILPWVLSTNYIPGIVSIFLPKYDIAVEGSGQTYNTILFWNRLRLNEGAELKVL